MKPFLKLGHQTVRVIVGSEYEAQESFTIHKDLICSRSPFFRKALAGSWKEAAEQIVPLPSDDPEIFQWYLQALYAGDLRVQGMTTSGQLYPILGGVFVLADKLQDVGVMNVVIRTIYELGSPKDYYELFFEMVTTVYEGTPGPCPIRGLLTDLYLGNDFHITATDTSLLRVLDGVPQEFLRDVAFGMMTEDPCILRSRHFWKSRSVETYLEPDPEVEGDMSASECF
ncbi:hypothetical protein P154DRAFT_528596 [Amniculicola lignicola CBS 123094]|uniref:BTB domain-containing protein n=1 Tax=Amniculicola lignicola CBS 123094 TaxID=1392246 RepID=A0A6A5X4Y2_9PLEO|nr:hypothetical protein P154DRAFT_528596 [Amniculicola lignicola CBS 123094]